MEVKERPILFSAPMVRAILDGRKSQTRRVVDRFSRFGNVRQFEPSNTPGYDFHFRDKKGLWQDFRKPDLLKLCPYGQPGDRLWVRETWAPMCSFDPSPETGAVYKADNHLSQKAIAAKWTPSIHMPRWASRITLEISTVRVERLQDISEADAKSEGCPCYETPDGTCSYWFRELWESINGAGSWAANPWVRVVDFRRLTNANGSN